MEQTIMDNTVNGGKIQSSTDSTRLTDMEELISLLDGYKHEMENNCKAKSDANFASPNKECAARANLVEKMVLIKRKSCAQFSTNGFCNNQKGDGDAVEKIKEDGGGKTGLDSPKDGDNCGAISLTDLEEMISLLNDCKLQQQKSEDEVDKNQARCCASLVRRQTLVEEMIMEKRRSFHSNTPTDVCVSGYMLDANGVPRKVVNVRKK